MEKRNLIYFIGITSVVLVIAILVILLLRVNEKVVINDFESCVNAGYPVLESYPEQCKTPDGNTFVKELPFNYSQGLVLMKNKETGEYACFGCSETMCIDPAPIMEVVLESEDMYCDDDFNVITKENLYYLSDGISIYKNLLTNEEGCFGCGNKLCVDIMIDENTIILNESKEKYCNEDFEIIQNTDIVLIENDFGNKIVYDSSENIDNLRIDCASRGGNFNECGSVCADDAEACILMCAYTCENIR